MREGDKAFRYDAYISYAECEPDAAWVWKTLVPRLEQAGLRVAVSGDAEEPGVERVVGIEQGIMQAKRTVIVLSPAYLDAAMADFENVLAQTMGIRERTYRLLPVKLSELDESLLPPRLSMLSTLDFSSPERHERQFDRLVDALRGPLPQRPELRGQGTPAAVSEDVRDLALPPDDPNGQPPEVGERRANGGHMSRAARAVPVEDQAVPNAVLFHREGEYWAIGPEDRPFRLRDTTGLRYLAHLVARPGDEVHVLALVAAVRAPGSARGSSLARATGRGRARAEGLHEDALDAGPVMDREAKAAYRLRLTELREELDQAEEWADLERASRIRGEIDALTEELARAVGLGGRDRRAASAVERARVNVTKAIKSALQRIAEHDASLGHLLASSVHTGAICSFDPGPGARTTWKL